ncbi:hypothetical protein ACHAXT_010015 [Thalassiosira profunda]
MKSVHPTLALAVALCVGGLPAARGFAPASVRQAARTVHAPTIEAHSLEYSRRSKALKATDNGSDGSSDNTPGFFSDITINPPYAIAYVAFLGFAFFRSATEPAGASNEVLMQYFANPSNPGFNELFVTVFNLLGLYVMPMACLLMPGAKGQKLPATPFVAGAMFGGYGLLGPYAITRKPNPAPISKADLGWFTSNVLENKLFNYLIAIFAASTYVTSGALASFISDPGQLISGYGEMFSETAFVSASSLDFVILTISAASLIPEDLARRGYEGKMAPELVAASTLLLPGVGAALYCALRPSLEEE